MPMNERVIISLTILITGFVVVFSVLLLLIGLIKLYGTIVSKALESAENKKKQQLAAVKTENTSSVKPEITETSGDVSQLNENGLNDELIAVIAAAVAAVYGEGTVRVKSIKRVPQSRPVWSTAGIFDNTRPF